MAALARELVRRGHQATFFHFGDVGSIVRGWDLPFVPLGAASHPDESMSRGMRDAGRVTGLFGFRPLIQRLANATAMLCEELPDALRRLSIDMVLSDQLEAAGGLASYHAGIPFISIAAALPINWEEGVPSPFIGWSYGEAPWHRYRNIASAFGAKRVMGPIGDVIETFADRWKLVQGRQIENYLSGFAQISQLTPSLDFPRRSLTRCFHYCGPLRDRIGATTSVPQRTRTHRAFASLGSLQGHRAGLFHQITSAAAASGLEVTIAHGGGLSPAEAERLSQRADVHAFVAQDQVMATTDIAILHGGLNTVLDALAQGVPIVLVPLAFEQGAIAARVERSGAGRVCRSRFRRQRHLSSLVREVYDNPKYTLAAARIQGEIGAAGGVRKAADIVETVLRTRQPVLRVDSE